MAPEQAPAAHAHIFDGLTEPQREAVTHVEGPLLIVAGPGSGKTRVITGRIANLILNVGIAPWNILAITFTNKAAGEMRDRVGRLLSERQARAVTVCTFHSLCARLIRQYADRLNLPPGYSIYDTADQKAAMKQAVSDLEIRAENFPPGKVLSTISNAKNELIDADAFAADAHDFYSKTVAKIFRKYQAILTANSALDFDDLLLNLVKLLREHTDVRDELRERYQYLLIDEYQDTNHVQFVIANLFAAGHRNLCVTGDPDQSIYRWRGADIRNILDFETHYPDAKVVRLEQNYRSTKRILAAADTLIRRNSRRKHKELWTDNDEGAKVRLVGCYDERQEADEVVRFLCDQHDTHSIAWGHMAVFYRVNHLSRVIEESLRTANIPYQIARGTAFYDRAEIKNAVAYLRAVTNPADAVNLLRIINTPARGISANTVKSLQSFAVERDLSIDQVIHRPEQVTTLNSRAMTAVRRFADLLDGWRKLAGFNDRTDPDAPGRAASLRHFVETLLRDAGLEDFYRNDKSDDEERLMNLGELVSSAQQFEEAYDFEHEDDAPAMKGIAAKLEAWLEQISLVSDVDAIENDQGAVTLMTLHAAKGLEYPVVCILGLEDGLLPHSMSNSNPEELEEERRLLFVGITRAEQQLMLSHARYRTVFGRFEPTVQSRFVRELPITDLHIIDESDNATETWLHKDKRQQDVHRQKFDALMDEHAFPVGCRVQHPNFGQGTVVRISATGAHTRAQVRFDRVGIKTLVLEYARLDRLD